MRRTLLNLTLFFVISSALISFYGFSASRASGSIHIWPGGEVYPSDAPIERVGNVYTLTANVNDSIVVRRDNIVLDGAGLYTLQGSGDIHSIGVDLKERSNVTVKGLTIKEFGYGILLNASTNNMISNNTVTLNTRGGIHLADSSMNSINGNTMTANTNYDVELHGSSNNSVYDNSLRRIQLTYNSTYNNVYNNHISNSGQEGIGLIYSSDKNVIQGNVLAAGGYYGIHCIYSSGQLITGNSIKERYYGILLRYSSNNTVLANTVENNTVGISLDECSYNKIFHNNLLDNLHNADAFKSEVNLWDDGYPSGGNYWSNYAGADSDGDGIGDASHVVDGFNRDNYPLMGPINILDAGTWNDKQYYVSVSSNSTISSFHFNPTEPDKYFSFDVTGTDGTTGFCRVAFSKELLQGPYVVQVNDEGVTVNEASDETHVYLYFVYGHSIKTVEVMGVDAIPEFPSLIMLPLFVIATLLLKIVIRKTSDL